jgi:hypothetical protein
MICVIASMMLIAMLSKAKHLGESRRTHQRMHRNAMRCFTKLVLPLVWLRNRAIEEFSMTLSRYATRRLSILLLSFMLSSCGGALTPTLPTAYVVRASPAATPAARFPTMPAPTPKPTEAIPTSLPSTTPALNPPLNQYRAWMEEAHATHPYGESVDMMWEVMICESSGRADVVAGSYSGLFQYDSATWAGDWNPYRDNAILDPRAQIFATAKAWLDGNQHWWGCYPI